MSKLSSLREPPRPFIGTKLDEALIHTRRTPNGSHFPRSRHLTGALPRRRVPRCFGLSDADLRPGIKPVVVRGQLRGRFAREWAGTNADLPGSTRNLRRQVEGRLAPQVARVHHHTSDNPVVYCHLDKEVVISANAKDHAGSGCRGNVDTKPIHGPVLPPAIRDFSRAILLHG